MYTQTTNGIEVNIITTFKADISKPDMKRYVHNYEVSITNRSGLEVQLLSREWKIQDSNGEVRIVKGNGVIGEQPIIAPDESYIYSSWSPIKSSMGKMGGKFIMKRTADDSLFEVIIPTFKLIAHFINN